MGWGYYFYLGIVLWSYLLSGDIAKINWVASGFDRNWCIALSSSAIANLTAVIVSPAVGITSRVESAGINVSRRDLINNLAIKSVSWLVNLNGDWDIRSNSVTSAELAKVINPPTISPIINPYGTRVTAGSWNLCKLNVLNKLTPLNNYLIPPTRLTNGLGESGYGWIGSVSCLWPEWFLK